MSGLINGDQSAMIAQPVVVCIFEGSQDGIKYAWSFCLNQQRFGPLIFLAHSIKIFRILISDAR
jgi:hypothetical protein